MTEPQPDWYRNVWSLDVKKMSWAEQTTSQVDFIVDLLDLTGDERILDLACGYGRHALEFARRGYRVTGVDITADYIEDATRAATAEGLDTIGGVEFVCGDVREVEFTSEFDVVLSLADGAIGYLEDDTENHKIFERVATALKPAGKHFIDICNADYAARHFPRRNWEIGENSVSLPQFDWNKATRRMLYGGWGIEFGKIARPPETTDAHSSTRLYSVDELRALLAPLGMEVVTTRAAFSDRPANEDELQMEIYARKSSEVRR